MRLQEMQPVVSPKDFAIDHEARYPEYSRCDRAFRLPPQSLLDLVGLRAGQKRVSVEIHAVRYFCNNAIRCDIPALAPRRIQKPQRKRLAISAVIHGGGDPQGF